MAFLCLTKKAAIALKMDIKNAVAHGLTLPALEDWVVDIIWKGKIDRPGILFYNRGTGFAIACNPAEYTLGYCLEIVKKQLQRLLEAHHLEEKLPYFQDLFSVIHLCRNNDLSAVRHMTQSKQLVNKWLNTENNQRVDNSYDLMMRINQDCRRINGHYRGSRFKEFLSSIEKIDKLYGIVIVQPEGQHNDTLH